MVETWWAQIRRLTKANDQAFTIIHEQDKKLAVAEMALRTAERDLERSLAELHLVQQDFRHLVATATRLPSKTQPIDFSRDPFAEDPTIPETWLTENGELPDIGTLEEIISGQGEAGEPRGPGSRSGAQGSA